jgi:hypothetical protein
MLAIQININVFLLISIVLAATFIGFMFRSYQIASLRKKVIDLENEMLSNHSEILELQKENAMFEQKLKQLHIPVISIKTAREEKLKDQPDVGSGSRKDNIKNAGS